MEELNRVSKNKAGGGAKCESADFSYISEWTAKWNN